MIEDDSYLEDLQHDIDEEMDDLISESERG
jgi:hypothetical protein